MNAVIQLPGHMVCYHYPETVQYFCLAKCNDHVIWSLTSNHTQHVCIHQQTYLQVFHWIPVVFNKYDGVCSGEIQAETSNMRSQ